VYLCIYV